jgi:hypothetical protein
MKIIYSILAVFGMFTAVGQVYEVTGHVQNTSISVLYAGIPQEIVPFGGKNCENIRIAGMQKNEEGKYIVTPTQSQVGTQLSISVEEKDKKGNYKVVHTTNYLIKPAPKPELSWGGFTEGSIVSDFSPSLTVGYGGNIPFGKGKDNFLVDGYTIVVFGLKGSLEGEGSEISELHLEALKAISKGSKVSISVKYTGNSSGRVTAMFEL